MRNTDLKLISKVVAKRLKDIIADLISDHQAPYVRKRYMSESRRLICDVLETESILNKKGYPVTMYIEKAFDSVDHFLLPVLQKYCFGSIF